MHAARREVDRPRQADAGAEDAVAVDVGFGDDGVGELDRDVERARGGGVDVVLEHPLGEDRARQVGDRDADVVVVEVDAEHEAGRAVERQQGRRPALLGDALVGLLLDDEAACLQVGDERRDGRARQAGRAGELGAARAAAAPQRVDEGAAVALPQGLKRA